jgi:hypothetical protein
VEEGSEANLTEIIVVERPRPVDECERLNEISVNANFFR